MTRKINLTATVPEIQQGMRLDKALADLFPDFSRSKIKTWIDANAVTVNGQILRPKDKLQGGETIVIATEEQAKVDWAPQDIPLDIVHEDEHLLIINKPAGLVVHPAAGNPDSTLVNALLHHAPALEQLPRAGLIHRLDKDTTGLLIIAKTLEAHTALVQALQAREIHRHYDAIATGQFIAGGNINQPIARHPVNRQRMAVVHNGKPAVTHYRVIARFAQHTHLRVQLETGRTHQIRVHFAHIHHALLGDQLYGGRLSLPKNASEDFTNCLRQFKRQALHARELHFTHPITGQACSFTADLPSDLRDLIHYLCEHSENKN